jgi:pimeloyl-ACP methyl ester carboxylesterase
MRAALRCVWGAFVFCVLVAVSSSASAQSALRYVETAHMYVADASAPLTAGASPSPIVVYLHGIGGQPQNGCGVFAPSGFAFATLCPQGPAVYGPGFGWADDASNRRTLARALAGNETAPVVLAGFSQGGYAIRGLLGLMHGRVAGALLIGADVQFSVAELRAAGVKRIALGAGRYDGTYSGLRRTYERLVRAGFDARFVDLGRVGHTYYPEQASQPIGDAVLWLGQGAASAEAPATVSAIR